MGELAEKVRDARQAHGLQTEIQHIPNPRTEKEGHYYNAKHQKLLDLGLLPHKLADTLIDGVIGLVEHYRGRIRPDLFTPRVDWRQGGKGKFASPGMRVVNGRPRRSSFRLVAP